MLDTSIPLSSARRSEDVGRVVKEISKMEQRYQAVMAVQTGAATRGGGWS